MPKFRKKPVIVEAIQWTGVNYNEVRYFMQSWGKQVERRIRVRTLEGAVYADEGDWIVKGVKGELYPCKPDIFEATYEPVKE